MQPNETAVEVPGIGLFIGVPDRTDLEFYREFYERLSQIRIDQVRDLAMRFPRTIAGAALIGSLKEPGYVTLTKGSTVRESFEPFESSTREPEHRGNVDQLVDAVFGEALDQDFEDGMKSNFSEQLLSLVRRYGISAMSEISYLITHERVNSEVASEALRWLGRMSDPLTRSYRLWLLERSLASTSARVRDGAALGLGSMGDPEAVPYVRQAIERESCVELREDLEQVLEELEGAPGATSIETNTKE